MTDYFDFDPLNQFTLARAQQVNSILEAVKAGFDKLPESVKIQQNRATFAEDTGAANAIIADLDFPITEYAAGLAISVKIAETNTGATTINVDGLGVKHVLRPDGTTMTGGELVGGRVYEFRYDGYSFQVVGGIVDINFEGVSLATAAAQEQAEIATEASITATSSKNTAVASEAVAVAAASTAVSAKTAAEIAAGNSEVSSATSTASSQIALGINRLYVDTAAGLAAVADGAYFAVPGAAGSDVLATIYQRVGATAVAYSTAPSKEAIDAAAPIATAEVKLQLGSDLTGVASTTFGASTPDSLTLPTPANGAYGPNSPTSEILSRLASVAVRLSAVGTGEIHCVVPNGVGGFKLGSKFAVSFASGLNVYSGFGNTLLPAGSFVLYKRLTGGHLRFMSGGAGGKTTVTLASPSVGDAVTLSSYANTVAVSYTVEASDSNLEKRTAALEDGTADILSGLNETLGLPFVNRETIILGSPSAGSTGSPAGFIYPSTPTPSPGSLGTIRFTTNGVGFMAVQVSVPQGDASYRLIASYPVTAVSGLNTFTGATGLHVPKGALISVQSNSGNDIRLDSGGDGLRFVEADFTTVGQVATPIAHGVQPALNYDFVTAPDNIAARLELVQRRQEKSPLIVADEKFIGSTLPKGWVASGAWTVNDSLIPPATGGSSVYAIYNYPSSIDRKTIESRVLVSDAASQWGICTLAQEGYGGIAAIVDGAAGRLRLYLWAGGALSVQGKNVAIPAGLIVSGRKYLLQVTKEVFVTSVKLTDLTTHQSLSLSETFLELDGNQRLAHGAPGVMFLSGVVQFQNFRVRVPYDAHVHAVVAGDSITESQYIFPSLGWGRLFANSRPGVVVAGRAGDEAYPSFDSRKHTDVLRFRPRFVVIALGTNDTSQTTWRTSVQKLVYDIEQLGAEPIFVTQVPRTASQTLRNAMNADIRGGYFGSHRYADLALAVSLNNDGVTWDPAFNFGDGIHPNAAGHAAMFAQFQADLPDVAGS